MIKYQLNRKTIFMASKAKIVEYRGLACQTLKPKMENCLPAILNIFYSNEMWTKSTLNFLCESDSSLL